MNNENAFRHISQMSPVILTVLNNECMYGVSNVSARNDKKWRKFTSEDVIVLNVERKQKKNSKLLIQAFFSLG